MMDYCQPTPYSILSDDGEDVFEIIFPDTDAYSAEKRLAMWSRFHDTGIGNADKTYWERCVKMKAQEVEDRYAIKFRVWSEYKARLAATKGDADLSDGKMTSNSINRTYDPPEVAVQGKAAEDYLADQNRTDYEQKTYGGLEPATVRDYGDAVENPFERWAAEFDKLFYWGL